MTQPKQAQPLSHARPDSQVTSWPISQSTSVRLQVEAILNQELADLTDRGRPDGRKHGSSH
ncbi:MAG: hypothetical protein ACFBSC_11605 [Microcoleaceae cyanobacterium]